MTDNPIDRVVRILKCGHWIYGYELAKEVGRGFDDVVEQARRLGWDIESRDGHRDPRNKSYRMKASEELTMRMPREWVQNIALGVVTSEMASAALKALGR